MEPLGIRVNAYGDVSVADRTTGRILAFSSSGVFLWTSTGCDGTPYVAPTTPPGAMGLVLDEDYPRPVCCQPEVWAETVLSMPQDMDGGPWESWVADTGNNRLVAVLAPDPVEIATWGGIKSRHR